jgi:succinate dehydrogenase / fumarate reductase, cytochrome b subunit
MSENSGASSVNTRPRSRPEFRNIDNIAQILAHRLPPAGIVSILHRVSGVLMFLIGIPFVLYLFQQSITSEISFEQYRAITGHWFGKLLLLALAWAFAHHFCSGIRFLALDLHWGIQKEQAQKTAYGVFGASAVLTFLAALKIFGVF